MPALRIKTATLESENGTFVLHYILEDGTRLELHGLSKEEAERRADRVGHYIIYSCPIDLFSIRIRRLLLLYAFSKCAPLLRHRHQVQLVFLIEKGLGDSQTLGRKLPVFVRFGHPIPPQN